VEAANRYRIVATVFISYKHESQAHSICLRTFADALLNAGKTQGISVLLDQYFAETSPAGPNEGWEIWSENSAAKADFILAVASRQYYDGYNLHHPLDTAPGIIPEIFIIRKRVRGEGYQPHSVRPLVLKPEDVPFVPDALSHLQRFSSDDIAPVLRWLTGGVIGGGPSIAWLPTPPTFNDLMVADCNEVRAAFANLLIPNARSQILLIKGESGLGKSTLTAEFAAFPSKIPGGPLAARLDLKSGLDIYALLEAFARKLRLRDVYLAAAGRAPLDQLSIIFDALERRAQPALLIFDTFESGGVYAQWVEHNVLTTAAGSIWLRVIVAGKQVPDRSLHEAAAWRHAAECHILKKLEWKDWTELASRVRPDLQENQLQELHKIVCGNHQIIDAALRAGAFV
jgi:hypothetical protein